MRIKFRESNQIVKWINKTNYSFWQYKNADVSIFQRHLSTKFQGLKKRLHEICHRLQVCTVSVGQWQRLVLYYNVTVYISVQSKEEYYVIWKAKPLKTQTDKGKW